jgi:hypothetical protein
MDAARWTSRLAVLPFVVTDGDFTAFIRSGRLQILSDRPTASSPCRSRALPGTELEILSELSSRLRPPRVPLHRHHRLRPLTRVHFRRPRQVACFDRGPFGASPPGFGSRSVLVVSHHLDGFLRSAVPGMLQPVPDLGFAGLHRGRSSPAEAGSDRVPDSLRRAHPTKVCSSPVAVPHHCGRSPLAVP